MTLNITTFTGDSNLYALIFSNLDLQDLGSFACASKKCEELIKRFKLLNRLERVCGFANDTIIEPWNQYRNLRVLDLTRMGRPLFIDEQTEFLQLLPNFAQFPAASQLPSVAIVAPRPIELFRACPEKEFCFSQVVPTNEGPSHACKAVGLFDEEARSSYLALSRLIFTLLDSIQSPVGQPYTPPVERAKALASSSENGVQNSVIEDAVWSIITILKGKGIASAEEGCKKLIQVELAKMTPEKVRQMERILKTTFETLKPLYTACKTIEIHQRSNARRPELEREAELAEHMAAPKTTLARLVGIIISIVSIIKLFDEKKLSTHILPIQYHGGAMHLILDFIGVSTIISTIFYTTVFSPFFPIRAEIRENAEGEEEVHYIPHPLRSRVRLCGDIVLITVTALFALELVSKFF